jgi:undecaprenyl diphosphate synthase
METTAKPLDPPRAPPSHVAVIMDGNGRWARSRGLPRIAGHRQGAESVRTAVKSAIKYGVSYLTLFGFSSENWKRPAEEVDDLMGLLHRYLRSEIAELHETGVRLRVIGERGGLNPDIQKLIEESEIRTARNSRLTLTLALNYGGRAELVAAARRLAEQVASGRLAPDAIDETIFQDQLSTEGIPDPDLLIRTSGEKRVSNFLLWQLAYAEFVFLDILWPDFTEEAFAGAISEFQRRHRRYGATGS